METYLQHCRQFVVAILLAAYGGATAQAGLVASLSSPVAIDALTPAPLVHVTPGALEAFDEVHELPALRGTISLSPPHLAVIDTCCEWTGSELQSDIAFLGGPAASTVYLMPPDTVAFDFYVEPLTEQDITILTVTAVSTDGESLSVMAGGTEQLAGEGDAPNYFGFFTTDGDMLASITVEVSSDIGAVLVDDPRIGQTEASADADLDQDGEVGSGDLALLLFHWGRCDAGCSADLNGDGSVDTFDLAILLGTWGNA